MMFLVTGMHKSGTTLVARTLHASSVPMIERGRDEGRGYDQGQRFERESCRLLNKRILGLPPEHSSWRLPGRASVSRAAARAMDEIVASAEREHDRWGAKDPRFCLTYPQWRGRLPEHRVVAVYRHPAQVWGHYLQNTGKPWAAPMLAPLVLRAWTAHNLRLLEIVDRSEALLVEYDRLMRTDEELERLGRFAGVPLRDVREPGLYRARDRSSRWVEVLDPFLGRAYPAGPLELFERLERRRSEQAV